MEFSSDWKRCSGILKLFWEVEALRFNVLHEQTAGPSASPAFSYSLSLLVLRHASTLRVRQQQDQPPILNSSRRPAPMHIVGITMIAHLHSRAALVQTTKSPFVRPPDPDQRWRAWYATFLFSFACHSRMEKGTIYYFLGFNPFTMHRMPLCGLEHFPIQLYTRNESSYLFLSILRIIALRVWR